MVELSQWRASIGGFHSRQKTKQESPIRWKQLLTKLQLEPVPKSTTTQSSRKTKSGSTTETNKLTPIKNTVTSAIHIEIGNTCCVISLVGLHTKYIL